MEHKQGDRRDLDVLPTNKVVGIYKSKPKIEALIESLTVAGFLETDIYVHHGKEGEQYIDADGSRRGFIHAIVRSYQRLAGSEARLLKHAEKALETGYYLVGLQTNGKEAQWRQAGNIFRQYTDSSVFFCGAFTIHTLQYDSSLDITTS